MNIPGAPYIAMQKKPGSLSRNSQLNRKDFSSNSWKPGTNTTASSTQPIDFNALNMGTNPLTAFGTGRFLEGLRREICMVD